MSHPDSPRKSPDTGRSRDNTTDYRALIARIDGTMAALAKERRRLETRAAEDAAQPAAEVDRA